MENVFGFCNDTQEIVCPVSLGVLKELLTSVTLQCQYALLREFLF